MTTSPSNGPDRGSDRRGRIFVVYATAQHQTERTAVAVAERLREHDFVVEVGDARTGDESRLVAVYQRRGRGSSYAAAIDERSSR